MDLNAFESFPQLDTQNMLAQLTGLPDQLENAWELGARQPMPGWKAEAGEIRNILISGMGGSAIGADLLSAYVDPLCPLPVVVHRDYGLPAWARGPQTLVIACSHSGNTEEALSSFQKALENGCRCVALSTGGKLSRQAADSQATLWTFNHHGPPRAAVGYSFGLLLALFARLGFIPDPSEELNAALNAMRRQGEEIRVEIPVVRNQAKRLAGQLMGRYVTVLGSGILNPVARRWKGQISELAKAWAQFEFLPEANHNTLAGIFQPEEVLSRLMVIFLRAASEHPRNQLRTELTQKTLMLEGINTDFADAQGETPLAQLWTSLYFGDYTSYYLAMAYDMDPTPITPIENFKREMASSG